MLEVVPGGLVGVAAINRAGAHHQATCVALAAWVLAAWAAPLAMEGPHQATAMAMEVQRGQRGAAVLV